MENRKGKWSRSARPVEVKWTDAPGRRDVRHLEVFLDEYENARRGFVVCRVPKRSRLTNRIDAIPWQELRSVLDEHR